ncbi:MAG TPA: hypothetical protein VK796_01915 [Cytophaga sp.]|nr:hypothetical protein [Cytophaga sp.]
MAIITSIGDVLDKNHNDSIFSGILFIPMLPGFIIYVLTKGDIHGWQPGPIGQVGRIAVCAFGSWMFWLPFIFKIYMWKLKRANKK